MIYIDPDYARFVNRTSRSSSAIGAAALVPRIVNELLDNGELPDGPILDYGAGKDAIHTKNLRNRGYDVTAYDIGVNAKPGLHDPYALDRWYSVVYASNVLNVQPSVEDLDRTIFQIAGAVAPGGVALVNYATSPRHANLGVSQVAEMLASHFAGVERIPGQSTPVWILYKPRSSRRQRRTATRRPGAARRRSCACPVHSEKTTVARR